MAIHKNIPDDQLHEPKGVASAIAMRAYISNGSGSGAWLPYKPENVVYVNEFADFPDPVGGIITLAEDTAYILGADVSVAANRIQCAHHSLVEGIAQGSVSLTYTGTDPLFIHGDDQPFTLRNIDIIAATADLFASTGAGNSNGVTLDRVTMACNAIGTFDNVTGVFLRRCGGVLNTGGIVFTGGTTNPVFEYVSSSVGFVAGTFLDISAVEMRAIRMDFSAVFEAAAPGVIGIVSTGTANMAAGSQADINNVSFVVATPLSGGITKDDVRWRFSNVAGVGDTVNAGDAYLDVQQEVTINTSGVYELINGGNWLSTFEAYFTTNANGQIEYIGERTINVLANATVTMSKVGGGADQLAARLACDGTTKVQSTAVTQNATPTSVACIAGLELAPGAVIDLRVTNLTSTSNVIIDYASLIVTRIP